METKCHCPHCHKPLEVLLDINIVATGKLPLPALPSGLAPLLPLPDLSDITPHRGYITTTAVYAFLRKHNIGFARGFTEKRKNSIRRKGSKLYVMRRLKIYNISRSRGEAIANLLRAGFPQAEDIFLVDAFGRVLSVVIIFEDLYMEET